MAAPTKLISTSQGFQDAKGTVVALGLLSLTLSQNAEITASGGQVTTEPLYFPLDANGKITSTAIWFSDELNPAGTTYRAILYAANGMRIIQDFGYWSIAGASADLSTMIPTSIGGASAAGVVLLAPSGAQNIAQPSGTSLNVNRFENIRFADQFTGADLGAKINAAIADLAGPGWIILPSGNFSISTPISVSNKEGIKITGQGSGQAAASAGTAIKWTGTSGSTMFTVTSSRWCYFSDFILDGNSLAGRCLDYTASNAVAASQKCVFERITFRAATQSPAQNAHVGSSTNDQISESAFIDCNHINGTTCFYLEGTQTANIRFVGGMIQGYTSIGIDVEGGTAYLFEGLDFENTATGATSVKVADTSSVGEVIFIECYFEELSSTSVAYSFPSGAGSRHSPTTIIGGRILFPSTSTAQVVFDFEQHANLVMIGTLFTANSGGQGGVIKLSAVGGTPNINTFSQVTLQDSWSIAALGSNSVLYYDNGVSAGPGSIAAMQMRAGGIDLWGGSIQFASASGTGSYRATLNGSELRLLDGSNNILGGLLASGTATTGATPWKANHLQADTGFKLASGAEFTGQTGTGTNIVTDNSPTIGGTPLIGRIKTTGSAPASGTVTGAGATGSVTIVGSSSDSFMLVQIVCAGAGPAALGTLTINLSAALGGARTIAIAAPVDSGSAWDARATIKQSNGSTTAPVFKWDNNAAALVAGNTYNVVIFLAGE